VLGHRLSVATGNAHDVVGEILERVPIPLSV
jgi:hypothetical protein